MSERQQTSTSLPVAVVYGGTDPDAFMPTVRSLLAAHPDLEIVFGSPMPGQPLPVEQVGAGNLAELVTWVAADHPGRDLLVVHEPVIVPPEFLDRAVALIETDMRTGSVSFLSNDASHLSFPDRNTPRNHQVDDHDEISITELLRTVDPPPVPAVVHVPAGGAVLLSRWALSADPTFVVPGVGSIDSQLTLLDHALRAQRRGFLALLDSGTFVARAYDLALATIDALRDETGRGWLHHRHRASFPQVFDAAKADRDSPMALELSAARAKVQGLRVTIDGSCLGPKEMGTQVQTLSLVAALAERDDVRELFVGVPGAIPDYARRALSHPKIQLLGVDPVSPVIERAVDVIHRPFQPDRPIPYDAWRSWASRCVVTVQDVIAYQVGAYQPNGEIWGNYRRDLYTAIAQADGVIAISDDVVRHLELERMPVEPDRVAVVPNGTDHLTGGEAESQPRGLASRGLVASRFLLVMGANYSHKNRDLAILAHAVVRQRHPDIALVLAGAAVPHGSSRAEEAAALGWGDPGPVVALPDVSSEERNWLLRHAEVVLYPTSAEGFGLVPFEAARFGTPTVEVPFGPLREVLPDLPVVADDWSPASMAEAVIALLDDPSLAEKQVRAAADAGERYTWSATAAGLVRAYRHLLAHPPRIAHQSESRGEANG